MSDLAVLAPACATDAFVCPPDHKHADTQTCYTLHKCRCTPCRRAGTARRGLQRRLQAYGRWDRSLRLPGRAAAHIMVLGRFGYSYERIAAAAGVSARTVWQIAGRHVNRIQVRVEASILGVRPTLDGLAPLTRIDPRGMRRRVQALACLGWSVAALAAELGVTRSVLSDRLRRTSTNVRTHREIAALFDRLWNTPPAPADEAGQRMIARTRRRALAAGWVPPLGWDDIDTDEEPPAGEEAGVDEIAVAFAVQGARVELTREERLLALTQLHARGHSDKTLARMLCVCDRTIARDREHLGLPANLTETGERDAA